MIARYRRAASWIHSRQAGANDEGRAIIEVVFLAVLLLIPTIYILIAVIRVQAATFAVAQAARDAGRLMDSAPSLEEGMLRAREAAAIALTDQNVPPDNVHLRFVDPGSGCEEGAEIVPSLESGAVYDICVIAVVQFPGVPTIVSGERNTVTGVFTLHVGEYREG